MINDFIILILPILVVFISLAVFFIWVFKSKEPYSNSSKNTNVKGDT
ncbi:flagellar basal body-associated protein FliL [Evansella vedderi]|uniref:Flagellar basal body-associated protein FliL n=1 Tax=Evansella vedderi TaxID=38282 RepID=A0ABT9ZTT3_9BACI|nr:flagellar basal body-associated protein FliL [Evansella vedderi]